MILVVCLIAVSLLGAEAMSQDYMETIEGDDYILDDLTRDRRLMYKNAHLWPKAILPYIIRPEVKNEEPDIFRVMAFVEDQSCVRFAYWNRDTSSQLGLGHHGHMNFYKVEECHSHVGFSNNAQGVNIRCCAGKTCLHEIGHALGFFHEHNNPIRDGWIRINKDNIQRAQKLSYKKTTDRQANITFPYDISSVMHYRSWMGAKPGTESFSVLFPELPVDEEYFYFFMEMASGYKCHEKPQCKGKLMKCENDGYQTILHGRCACKCPTGLDSDNLCKTPLKKVTSASWPKGQYALPMTRSGCPGNRVFQGGFLMYSGTGGNSLSAPHHMMGKIEDTKVELHFCTKTTKDEVYDFEEGEKFNWPTGNYCIYRKGNNCPQGFTTNTIYHRSVNTPKVSGKVSDGVYDTNIELKLCCSLRGFHEEPMSLPTGKPFTLFKHPKEEKCQDVEGMRLTEETFTLTSSNALTIDSMFLKWASNGNKSLVVKLCYYRPVDMDCGGTITLSKSKPEATIEMTGSGRTDLQCTWVVKGNNAKGTLVLEFEDFNLKKNGNSCDDKIEVRHSRIGQLGQVYTSDECPSKQNPLQSIRSIFDKLHLTFSTHGNSKSSFKAKIKWTTNEDMCYNVENRGFDYDGSVNYTRSFVQCLPWAQMTKCPHNPFRSEKYVDDSANPHPPLRLKDIYCNLVGNNCRNPDNSFRPWCYTDKSDCKREYCDVCGLEKPFDRLKHCNRLRNKGFGAVETDQALYHCAKTFLDLSPNGTPRVKYTEVSCDPPTPPGDGTLVGTLKPKYKVGETVEYKCNKVSSVVMSKCLTSGQWSQIDSSCLPCSSDQTFYNNACYGLSSDSTNHFYYNVLTKCSRSGGVLAAPKSVEESEVIRKIADENKYNSIWIAITDPNRNGNFGYQDGSKMVWENWADGKKNSRQECVLMTRNQLWENVPCGRYGYKFVCAFPIHELSDCVDVFEDMCSSLLRERPSLCVDQPNFAGQYCRNSCGICKDRNILCPVEKANTDVVSLSTQGPIISIGEYVEYECDRFKYKVRGHSSRTCLQNGKLSGEPLECSDCPTGFKLLNEACHGSLHTALAATFSDAKEACKKVDGYLALPKSQEENDLISSFGDGKPIRIGSTNLYQPVDVWDDGVYITWTNWETANPFRTGKLCTVMTGDKKWVKVDCNEKHGEYPIVCTIPDNSLCYDNKDKGVSYNGWVNYSDEFESCLPWAQTSNCNHHAFREGDATYNLEENYCRNPDGSDRPWCYTDETCSWSFCDVCGTYKPPFDRLGNCQALKANEEFCTKNKRRARYYCMETCRDELNIKAPVVTKYIDIRCGAPQPPINGAVVGKVRNQYKIGDTIEIKCKSESWSVFSRCLTSGQWSEARTACLDSALCSDFYADRCSKQLNYEPNMCKEYEGYAKKYCAKTCGFCHS